MTELFKLIPVIAFGLVAYVVSAVLVEIIKKWREDNEI